jgi:hypothetical protein
MIAERGSGVRPPYDEQLAVALPALSAKMRPSLTLRELTALRSEPQVCVSTYEAVATGNFTITTELASRPDHDGAVKILPCIRRSLRAPIPLIYYVHGGGMVAGDYRSTLETLLVFASDVGFAVALVDYRLAPEHPFPAGIDDCYAGLAWLCAEGARRASPSGSRIQRGGWSLCSAGAHVPRPRWTSSRRPTIAPPDARRPLRFGCIHRVDRPIAFATRTDQRIATFQTELRPSLVIAGRCGRGF